MEHKRIIPVLICVLAAACGILAAILGSVSSGINTLPESSVEDMIALLEEDGIFMDRELIRTERLNATVYVCDSPDYNRTVAELLNETGVMSAYAVPDGEVMIMSGGARFEFGSSFTFRYFRSGRPVRFPAIFEMDSMAAQISESKRKDIGDTVTRFLDRGSGAFEELNVEISVDSIWESEGKYYALCSRSIDGIEIAGNLVLCAVEEDIVTEAYGTWCFLTPPRTYSAQLSDLLNILFNVKKQLAGRNASPETDAGGNENEPRPVRITEIELCYSLYFYGGGDSFCLIPCWRIDTDTAGEMIYNAIDSTLYTVK